MHNLINDHRRLIILLLLFIFLIILGFFSPNLFPFIKRQEKLEFAFSDITFVPTISDSIGVDPKSDFILTSDSSLVINTVKSSLKVEPEATFEIEEISNKKYKISFLKPLKDNTIYKFLFSTTKDLSWAFQIRSAFRVIQTLPRDKATGVPINSAVEVTFSHESYEDFVKYFQISPKVEGRFERHKRTVAFIPKGLKYGTLYTVTVKKGLPLVESKELLDKDYVFQFETVAQTIPQDTLRIGFTREMFEYASDEKPVMTLYVSNFNLKPTLSVDVYKFSDIDHFIKTLKEKAQIPTWARYSNQTFLNDVKRLEKVLGFDAPVEEQDYSGYFVFPQALADGFYLVEVKSKDQKVQAWLQITDIASYLSISKTKTLVWINDLKTNIPVVDAKLTVVDTNVVNTTDSEGIAFYDTPKEHIKDNARSYIKVETSEGKSSVVPILITSNFYEYGGYYKSMDGYGWNFDSAGNKSEKYWSYLYLDRQLYLPTDTVNYWGIVRDRDNLGENIGLKLIITKTDYRSYYYQPVVIFEKDISPSRMGTFIGEIPISNFKTGYYSIQIKDGQDIIIQNGFSVETYTKPAYKIEINPSRKAIITGESIDFEGKTVFFEGTPVSNVKLKYSGVVSGEITTDEKGEFKVNYQPQYLSGNSYSSYYPTSSYLRVVPFLSEEGEIEGGARVMVFGSKLTIKTSSEVEGNQGTVKLKVNNVTLDRLNSGEAENDLDFLGTPASNQIITGKLYENEWVKKEIGKYYDFINKVTRKRYRYNAISNFLKDVSLTTDENGEAIYKFEMNQNKYYRLDLESNDKKGRTSKLSVFLYGRHGKNVGMDDYYYLEKNEREGGYSIGEDVILTFKKGQEILPSGEDNRYLYRLAQRGIKNYKVLDKPVYSFTFLEHYVPNVVANAVNFNGRTYITSNSLSLIYKNEQKKLAIDVSLDKESYKPQETVNLNLAVKDKSSIGQKSEVNISLVDEALFKLKEQRVDILKRLYRSVSSGVLQSYSSHQYPAKAGGAEGGGCFLAGTKILMSGKKERNIEDIKPNDFVLTRENPYSSNLVNARVTKTFRHVVYEYLLINGFLRVTPEHNLFVNGRWTVAEDIKLGDRLLNKANNWFKVTSIERKKGKFSVYNLEIDKLKTFFADNVYVHNQKGRELFVDNAFFGSIVTNNEGEGKISFKLPDNLTSWRITYQAISDDLGAGDGTKLLPVQLPFFVDAVINKEYLEDDKPVIKTRAFGQDLDGSQEVEFSIKAPTLGLENGEKVKAKASEAVFFSLPDLTEGKHKIIITGKARNRKDTLIREINVYKTRLKRTETKFYSLSENIDIQHSSDSPTTLVFSDQNRGKFYSILKRLSYTYGDRIDQKLARIYSMQLLKEYFGEKEKEEELKSSNYQTQEGGISLFPYSDNDLVLSAKVAAIADDLFDKQALSQYFYKIIDDPKEGEERIAAALFGLASLDEPVLIAINSMLVKTDLTPNELLYLGLAASKLGDKEKGRGILKKVLKEYSEDYKPYIRIKVGRDQDDILQATALAANLAAMLNEEQNDSLFKYITQNYTQDILIYLEELIYLVNSLPAASSEPVQFTYILEEERKDIILKKGQTYKLQVTPKELSQIRFENIRGNVGLTSYYTVSFDSNRVKKDVNISINRDYSVSGRRTNSFNEADLVKITLDYSLGSQAWDGCYQVSDFLPSGLKVVTRLYSRGVVDQDAWYPYDIVNQRVNFCVYKGSFRSIVYYARVISKGKFKAESATIQSLKSADSFNISEPSIITIK